MSSTPAALQLPVDCSDRDEADAVQALRACAEAELRRARQRHRRALDALVEGRYDGLSDGTRRRLIDRLRRHLRLLDAALSSPRSAPTRAPSDVSDNTTSDEGAWRSLWALLR